MHTCAAALLALLLAAGGARAGEARFLRVDYQGDDGGPVPGATQFANPVIAGFYPDPSAIRVGEDYYLVTSSFGYFPGLPVFHSTDLVSWRQIGNAIDRVGQMPYGEDEALTRGLFAATISHHDGTFYIANTCFYCPGRGMGNFVITARDPAGPWSDPAWLELDGIDPSIFFDDDGRAWLVNNGVPEGEMRYDGHRAIFIQQFDAKTLSLVGPRLQLVDAGVDPASNPEHVEGPHVFKHDGWYYLTAAEGGTGEQHAQMIWRSRQVAGPYEAWAGNPTLTQRDLDPARPDPVTSTGHAQFVRAQDDTWWAVFLATRPYRGNQYNLGRETFLLPVQWHDGWPVILPRGEAVPAVLERPSLPRGEAPPRPTGGPMAWSEAFDGATLSPQWVLLDPPARPWYASGTGGLRITPSATPLGAHGQGAAQPSYVGHRLQHHRATFSATLDPGALEPGELAGLALLQNESAHVVAALERGTDGAALVLLQRAGEDEPETGRELARVALPDVPARATLRFRLAAPRLDVDYALDGGDWQSLATDLDASLLSVDTAGGFIGNTFGPYAVKRGHAGH